MERPSECSIEVLSPLIVPGLLLPRLLVKVLDLAIVDFILCHKRSAYHGGSYN